MPYNNCDTLRSAQHLGWVLCRPKWTLGLQPHTSNEALYLLLLLPLQTLPLLLKQTVTDNTIEMVTFYAAMSKQVNPRHYLVDLFQSKHLEDGIETSQP